MTTPSEINEEESRSTELRFIWILAAAAAVLAVLPAVIAYLATPAGSYYLGYQFNSDDHMVYAAWMRQSMDGHFFFDNRFTTDKQPGLTVHLYFFALGLVAKLTSIVAATRIARVGFSLLFVWLIYRMVNRLDWTVYATKLAVALTIVGGGFGFLVWHNFGQEIVRPSPLSGILGGRLPTDVWQPEGFVFPSMLTNSLFMVSLCLIVTVFGAFITSRTDNRNVLVGALALGVLMNIHSYDALLIGLVMIGFVAASAVQRELTWQWVGRAAVISAGMIPAGLWFVHVLQNDPVFQLRAATETYAPNFRQVLFGYLPLMALALWGAATRAGEESHRRRRLAGVLLAVLLFVTLFVAAANHTGGYFLSAPQFAIVFAVAVASVALASEENATWNLLFAWAVVGTISMYFPGLFQRKLAMGLSVPWAILAAYGLHGILRTQERSARNLVLTLTIIILGASSVRWFAREILLIRENVSSTTRHPVYLSADANQIVTYLNGVPGRKVVLALPGVNTPVNEEGTNPPKTIPDAYQSPSLPDLAPIVTGLTGAYSYAGHWSETPDYTKKVGTLYHFFLREPFQSIHQVMTPEERADFIRATGANYAVLPVQASYPDTPFVAPDDLGETVVRGSQFQLIKLKS